VRVAFRVVNLAVQNDFARTECLTVINGFGRGQIFKVILPSTYTIDGSASTVCSKSIDLFLIGHKTMVHQFVNFQMLLLQFLTIN
jgi:hypothetical protein